MALPVGKVVAEYADQAERQQRTRCPRGHSGRLVDEGACVQRVHRRYVDEDAPRLVETGVVVYDVDRVHVPRLPPEKFEQVDPLGKRQSRERRVHLAVALEPGSDARDPVQHPERHREPAVKNALNVVVEEARVEDDAPEDVVEEAAGRGARVYRARETHALAVQERAREQAQHVEGGNEVREIVHEDGGPPPPYAHAHEERHVCNGAVRHRVVLVARHVASRRHRPHVGDPGQKVIERGGGADRDDRQREESPCGGGRDEDGVALVDALVGQGGDSGDAADHKHKPPQVRQRPKALVCASSHAEHPRSEQHKHPLHALRLLARATRFFLLVRQRKKPASRRNYKTSERMNNNREVRQCSGMPCLFVRESTVQNAGGGLFTKSSIKKGTYIISYIGRTVSKAVVNEHDFPRAYTLFAGARYKDAHDPSGRLVMNDGRFENVHNFSQLDWQNLHGHGVEWHGEANLARFVNHGNIGKRNCSFKSYRGKPIGFVATRDITPGEELLTNYGSSYWNRGSSDYCFYCNKQGLLIECDTPDCRRSFHLPCAKVSKVPKGAWKCPVCVLNAFAP